MSLPRVGRDIAPAYFDRDTNTHEMLKGRHGAMDTVILGPDGNPLFTVANPAHVKDADVESRLQNLESKLDDIRQRMDEDFTTQLSSKKVQLVSSNLTQNISASAGNFVFITISPPAGELWRIKMLRILAPRPSSVGATSGTHAIHVIPMSTGSGFRVLYAQANYDIDINILSNIIVSATTKEPSTEIAQQNAILNIAATNDRPLYIRYDNYTNVDLTDRPLTIVLSREVEYIA